MSTHRHSFGASKTARATAPAASVGVWILSVVVGRWKRTYAMGNPR
jgi:hypothetical protein